MKRLYKKWWFVNQLYNEESNHCVEKTEDFLLLNGKAWIERATFLKQITREKMREEDNIEKKKKIMNEYNSIIDSLILEDKWIDQSEMITPDNRRWIKTNSKSEDKLEIPDLIQELFSRYDAIWIKIGIPILTFILGILLF